MVEERNIHWLWLKLKTDVSGRKCALLLGKFSDADAIYQADRSALTNIGLTEKEITALLDKDISKARAEKEMCDALGILVLPCNHPAYPKELLELPDHPILFYAKGDLSLLGHAPKLTMVGSRKCSDYGKGVAFSFAKELAENGVLIVSGMAEGIDGASHMGAIRGRGKTIALLGAGIDVEYPIPNLDVKKEVEEKGLVLSEFPLGTPAYRTNFPYRNRILSALSDGVLVVEAGKRSGALITAHAALDQGKEVFAIPSDITRLEGEGSNRLIRDGEAQMVTDAAQVMESLTQVAPRPFMPVVPEMVQPTKKPKLTEVLQSSKSALSPEEEQILEALGDGCEFEELMRRTGYSAGKLGGILTMMEISGQVKKLPGNQYRKVQE